MTTYEPLTTASVPMLLLMRRSVSCANVSESERERSSLARVTVSPGMVRSRSPAASSVVNISESAVESHAESALPDTFFMAKTATERRGLTLLPLERANPVLTAPLGATKALFSCFRVAYQPIAVPATRMHASATPAATRLMPGLTAVFRPMGERLAQHTFQFRRNLAIDARRRRWIVVQYVVN